MVLTCDILEQNGFLTNHPERIIKKYYCASAKDETAEWRIMIDQEYLSGTNTLVFNVNMWLCNENGAIIKRASLSNVTTTEELNSLIELCNIPKILK